MLNLSLIVVVLYGVVVLSWVVRRIFVRVLERKLPFLSRDYGPRGLPGDLPLVSVVIPAKDEEQVIGGCLESVLAQTYPNFEVLVVDDRSADGTAHVVQEFARRDHRVQLISNRGLPAGWTGKTYALTQAVKEASGNWLWFVDADTGHEPESLAVMLKYAAKSRSDMVTMLMAMRNDTFWERVIQPLAGIVLMGLFNLVRINQSKHVRSGFANGQYILVRRDAYEAVGGHRAVADQFLEDVQLGRRLKQNGFRIKVAMGRALSSTRMYQSLGEIVSGWSRIYYGATSQSVPKLILAQLSLVVASLTAFVAPPVLFASWLSGVSGWLVPAATVFNAIHLGLLFNCMYHFYGFSRCDRRYLFFYPISCVAVVGILARSTLMCFTHKVTWRGTHYNRKRFIHPAEQKAGMRPHRVLVHQ